MCLQEIKASIEEIPKNFKKKYKNISINSGKKKGFSGTLIYSDESFVSESFCETVDIVDEGRIIEQHYANIVLFNIYVPNGKMSEKRLELKINFFDKLFIYCEKLRLEGKSIIICGDFNTAHMDIDLKESKIYNKSGFTNRERDCIDKFIQKGYIDTYRYIHGEKRNSYTWWSYRSNGKLKNEGWRIDYIFVSSDLKNKISNAFILDDIKGSDHCPIGIELKF